ncbi:hypothetical protein BH11MYX3_BH11MYX3_49460 [soil metagenome]
MRRRVWCETVPYDELVRPPVVDLVARHGLDLLLAVRPWQLVEVADVVRRFRDQGVFVAVWPMLADTDGRWASASSAPAFIAFADALLTAVPFADELVLDLEPPIAQLAKWKNWRPTWRQTPSPSRYHDARDALVEATGRWQRERRITTAVLPFLALELRGQWIQRAVGTPATPLHVDRHSVMAYTSLIEGWSRGVFDRRRSEVALAVCARLARFRFGAQVGLSLGTVGVGAFADEPSYRGPAELARDVAIASAAGIHELSLFDLGGILRRGPAEAWLEAFGAMRAAGSRA